MALHAWCNSGSMSSRVGWALLTLVAISLTSMPVTQDLWTWDGFLHGGPDFETGAFLILVSFCLVMVLARSLKIALARMLGFFELLIAPYADKSGSPFFTPFPVAEAARSGPGLGLPLLI
jgi:hypothetical protein